MTVDLRDKTLYLGIGIGLVVATLIAFALRGFGDDPDTSPKANVSPIVTNSPGYPVQPEPTPEDEPSKEPPVSAISPAPVAPAPGGEAECPEQATYEVSTAKELEEALAAVKPGDTILMMDGTYEGKFVAKTPGTKDARIHLCGGPGAILDGGGPKKGYGLHLDGASFWTVIGFTVTNSQKGVMADGVQNTIIQGLSVHDIGDEAIHLRNFSSDNLVIGNTIARTGLRREKFGEGVYIGNAESNWSAEFSRTGGKPDKSDRNVIRDNKISETTAESIDIKEGTTGGKIINNTFDGSSLRGSKHNDSWVDIKGNDWLIEGNTGTNSKGDGFQTHEIQDGWGTNNVFRNNTANLNGGSGYGFSFTPALGNKADCSNKVSGAAKGLTNIECS